MPANRGRLLPLEPCARDPVAAIAAREHSGARGNVEPGVAVDVRGVFAFSAKGPPGARCIGRRGCPRARRARVRIAVSAIVPAALIALDVVSRRSWSVAANADLTSDAKVIAVVV